MTDQLLTILVCSLKPIKLKNIRLDVGRTSIRNHGILSLTKLVSANLEEFDLEHDDKGELKSV